jgi:hypothetical protein
LPKENSNTVSQSKLFFFLCWLIWVFVTEIGNNMKSTLLVNFLSAQYNISIMLFDRCLKLILLAHLNLYVHWTAITYFLQPLATTILLSASMFDYFLYHEQVMQYLSLCNWHISLSIMSSRFIHTVTCGRISFLLKHNNILLWVCVTFSYPFICWWSL